MEKAAVHRHDRAADPTGAVGGQEQHHDCDLVGRGGAVERLVLEVLPPSFGIAEFALRARPLDHDHALGLDAARIDPHNPDAIVDAPAAE